MSAFKMSFIILAVAVILCASFTACSIGKKMGGSISDEEKKRFAILPNHDGTSFVDEEPVRTSLEKGAMSFDLFRHLLTLVSAPEGQIPQVCPKSEDFSDKPDEFSVRWFGHSMLIFEIAGTRFITDPVFGNAAPVPFAVRRYCESPIAREDLPELDFVLISHDHYDHLEYETILALRNRKQLKFVTMLGVGAHLRKWGVPAEQIIELNWNEKTVVKGVTITAQTARHFSGRTFGTRNETLWGSFVFEGANKRVFFGADSGYGKHFKKIGDTYGPFDLVCLEIDAWNENWPDIHMFPSQAITAMSDLRGDFLLPIHWGVFDLATHRWDESILILSELAEKNDVKLTTPIMGEKIVPAVTPTHAWWKQVK